jgi:outer membrane protein assembly factor BamA
VFDNTITPALNISNGTKFKVYSELLYGLNKGNKNCYNIGADIRNYQKLYKNFILANRLAYAHSDGNAEVEYLLGGVDNWLSPQTDPANGSQGPDDRFAFQALETSLRGYKQSARTGNNFAVFTTELRLPVLTTFMKRPIQSAVLKNLQLVAFADAGAAWKGFLPTTDNMTATYTYPQVGAPPVGLNNVSLIFNINSGLALGYGAGLRTSLFGYFMRLDAAWNIDGIKQPIIYFALGTDF